MSYLGLYKLFYKQFKSISFIIIIIIKIKFFIIKKNVNKLFILPIKTINLNLNI